MACAEPVPGHDRLFQVLAKDHQWDAWTGNTPEALASAVGIVQKRGFKVCNILTSPSRYHLLWNMGCLQEPRPSVFDEGITFQGIPMRQWSQVMNDHIYVIGDEWPLTQPAVVVLLWQRTVQGTLP